MGYWFTGTSTGNVYEVGRSYTMAGDTYTANWDGTFTNNRTGNSLVGSSQDDRVTFGYTGSLTGSGSGSAGTVGPGSAQVSSGGGPATSGPGAMGAVSGGQGASPSQSGKPSAAAVASFKHSNSALKFGSDWGFVGGGPDPEKELSFPYYRGMLLPIDKQTSNVDVYEERYGDAELGNPTWFASWGVWLADQYVGLAKTENVERDLNALPGAVADGAVSFASYLDARRERVEQASKPRWQDPLKVYRDLGQYPF